MYVVTRKLDFAHLIFMVYLQRNSYAVGGKLPSFKQYIFSRWKTINEHPTNIYRQQRWYWSAVFDVRQGYIFQARKQTKNIANSTIMKEINFNPTLSFQEVNSENGWKRCRLLLGVVKL